MWIAAGLYFLSPRDARKTIAVKSAAKTAISIRMTEMLIFVPPCKCFDPQNAVQIHAARADTAGKITNSFSSWLLILKPYFLPVYTLSTSG